MSTATYRSLVVGAILSSFLVGLHMPVLHDILDHGASPRWDVLVLTALFVLSTLICGWILLRTTPAPRR